MATHSSILAWRIPWTEEPGGLQSIRSQRVGHDLTTKPPPPASPVTGKLVGDTWGKRWGPSEEKVGTGVKQPQAKGKATRPWKTKDLTSPRASGGSMALHAGLFSSRTPRRIYCCYFKPPSLWQFVMASLGNQYSLLSCVFLKMTEVRHIFVVLLAIGIYFPINVLFWSCFHLSKAAFSLIILMNAIKKKSR